MGRERLTLGVLAVLLGLVPLVSSALPAQVPPADSIRISISSGDGKAQAPTLLNGFLRALHGQTIPYHSSHPDANQALICRTRSDMLSISWETDTVRGPAEQGSYRFIWLAGMDFGGFGPSRAPRTFHLAVNGTEWFVFRNRKDSTAHRWTETGPAGATLEFRSTLTDQYGDLFGEMTMTVPEGRCVPGVPIRIDVRAEDAGLPDWYMTMAYTFAFTCSARCEPVLLNEQGAPAQLVRVSLDNLHPGRRIVIERPGRRMIDTLLQVGANALLVSVRPVGRVTDLPILVTVDGRTASAASVRMTPVRHREIYLLSYSHNDIGYSDPQPVVLKKQWSYLERALDLIRRTKDFPVEAQYRWNVEILWPFMSFLEQADESRRAEIVGAVRDGHLGLNAYYANVLTGIAQPVEMSHSFDQARALRTQYGFPMETALITDIPGFTWGIVTALAHAGVKYFAMAPNAYDRIGYAYELWGDKPFWWMSQSGEERVLAWLAGASYSSFHDGSLSQRGDEKMFSVLRALEERSPFSDIIQMPYTINGDNGPPDELLPEFVRSWNARYVSPRLIIATHEQMFKALVADSGDSLKTVAGDFTPYWEDGVFSTAREAELTRSSVNRLIQAEALWAMRAPRLFPDALSREAWRNVTLWDEHTWGAWNSITEPDAPAVRAQWEYKRRFALESDRQSRELLGLASAPRSGMSDRFIDVVNTHSWRRSDLVILTAARSAGVRGVRSWDDRPVPAQRLTTGELAFSATDVPPLGSRRYVLVRRGKDPGGSAWADGLTVGNEFLTLRVDSVTGGIVSLVRRRDGVEFVDASAGGLNAYVYVAGRDPAMGKRLTNVRVRVQEPGGLVASLVITGDAPGCASFSTVVRVVSGVDWVDIINRFNKRAVREKEGVHFAYPFRISAPQPRYDVASAIVRPELDQIGGACKNFFSAQSWVDVSNDTVGVTLALVDAPLFELGAITAEQPWMRTIQPSSRIWSYILNNYWHTNYKADQEGEIEVSYHLRTHGAFDAGAAARFGSDSREPLLVLTADTTRSPLRMPFAFSENRLLLRSIRPLSGTDDLLILTENPTDASETLRLAGGVRTFELVASDADGRIGEGGSGDVVVPPKGTRYVVVHRRP